ncbi:hypothetical protein EOG37_12890 [Clavibacter michiganensis subsp. michiganensis]|uniref:hypothetical protein n=1 Tax=Clavibacter michiganensis TaxID=28447 RepID=UPI001C64D405|nr:hypothetical protein [Clavibacter michiganensis]MBW8027570.1 hypothetical protein [Clavibacter michiganensis subsp. michiganensis]
MPTAARSLPTLLSAVAVLLLAGCATEADPPSSNLGPTSSIPTETAALDPAEHVDRAEQLARQDVGTAPIWEGVTFTGTSISDDAVCVDRNWGPGGGPGDLPAGSVAGYVVVTFPSEDIADPESGVCGDRVGATATTAPAVQVPDAVADDPGLLISSDVGEDWPLTVPYVIVRCTERTLGGQLLQLVTLTAPDDAEFAVNGTARDHTDLPDIEPIWAPDPDVEVLRIVISPVIDAGLARC